MQYFFLFSFIHISSLIRQLQTSSLFEIPKVGLINFIIPFTCRLKFSRSYKYSPELCKVFPLLHLNKKELFNFSGLNKKSHRPTAVFLELSTHCQTVPPFLKTTLFTHLQGPIWRFSGNKGMFVPLFSRCQLPHTSSNVVKLAILWGIALLPFVF